MAVDAAQDYDKMNWLYNAFYGDKSIEELKQLYYVKDHWDLLQSYDRERISILDSACGNGVQATALALHGYRVTATDISGEMIKLATEFAEKYNVRLAADVKAWSQLPEAYGKDFDIVLCTGNSIVHSADAGERMSNLQALAKVLKSKGTLVVETRNWEKIIRENKSFTAYDKVIYRDKEYIPLYHWILNGMEQEAVVEIIFQEIDRDLRIKLYESSLRFTPFTHKSLLDMLKTLGLDVIHDNYEDSCDWYFVYARSK